MRASYRLVGHGSLSNAGDLQRTGRFLSRLCVLDFSPFPCFFLSRWIHVQSACRGCAAVTPERKLPEGGDEEDSEGPTEKP